MAMLVYAKKGYINSSEANFSRVLFKMQFVQHDAFLKIAVSH